MVQCASQYLTIFKCLPDFIRRRTCVTRERLDVRISRALIVVRGTCGLGQRADHHQRQQQHD